MKHKCKAPDCNVQISERFLMCSRHWSQVTRSIQLLVHRSWLALNQGIKPEQISAYRAAVASAVSAVSKNPQTELRIPQ
jgi:hypothetical protein